MAKSQRESRVLYCRFSSDNELTSHAWQVHAKLDDDGKQTMKTCVDQPVWECATRNENVFRILDFADLFAQCTTQTPNSIPWFFHKDLIPYAVVRTIVKNPSLSHPMDFIRTDIERIDDDFYFLIVDLANHNVRFEPITFTSQAGAFVTLESCYHAFVTRLEQWFLQSQLTKFMRDQDRASTQMTTQLHNMMYHG